MLRQRFCRPSGLACLLMLVVSASWVRSEEPKDKPAAPTALQIAQWIKDLDSDDFQVRQQATGRLIGAGKQAAGQVAKAAEGESAEVTVRSMDVLTKLLQSADAATKAEAKKALEGLSMSKNAGVARQAETLINPAGLLPSKARDILQANCLECHGGKRTLAGVKILDRELLVSKDIVAPGSAKDSLVYQRITAKDESVMPPDGKPRLSAEQVAVIKAWIAAGAPAFPAGAPRIIIGGTGVAGPGLRISVKNVDGNKTIEAVEGGNTTRIEESAKGDIKVVVTETVDGKEKVSKYEAKDADELKKKHPEAHALYEKYSKFAPGIAVRFGGIGGGALPGAIAPARPLRVGVVPQKALDQIEEAKKQFGDATDKLRKLAEESRISPEAVKKLADQLDAAKKQLEEVRAQLPK